MEQKNENKEETQKAVTEEEKVLENEELNEVSGGWEPGKKYVGRGDVPMWLM